MQQKMRDKDIHEPNLLYTWVSIIWAIKQAITFYFMGLKPNLRHLYRDIKVQDSFYPFLQQIRKSTKEYKKHYWTMNEWMTEWKVYLS